MKRYITILLSATLLLTLMLAAACKTSGPRLPFLPPAEPVTAPAMRWDVRADFSILTPHVPAHSKHTRLHDGPLPWLYPSDEYGMLLPYAGAVTLNDGRLREAKYGFVTIDGLVVTDLIFDRIERATFHNQYGPYLHEPRQAYKLTINMPGATPSFGYPPAWRAAIALDGSWMTEFEYVDVVFQDEVIFLLRDYDTLNIDVFDYSGQKLYNVLDKTWSGRVDPGIRSWMLTHYVSEGFVGLQGNDGNYFFVEIQTGEAYFTDYPETLQFSGGLAAVRTREGYSPEFPDLWGYINKDFELVIPVIFSNAQSFMHGRAVAETPDGAWHLLNTRGEALMSVPQGYRIDQFHDGFGIGVYPFFRDSRLYGNGEPQSEVTRFYTNDLVEIEIPSVLLSPDGQTHAYYNGGGWFFGWINDGMLLFSESEEFFFPFQGNVYHIDGKFAAYQEFLETGDMINRVMSLLDMTVIFEEQDMWINTALKDGEAVAFFVNYGTFWSYSGQVYRPATYRLIGLDGNTLASGPGALSFDESAGLFAVLGGDFFKWLDKEGNTLISIPLMSYTLD